MFGQGQAQSRLEAARGKSVMLLANNRFFSSEEKWHLLLWTRGWWRLGLKWFQLRSEVNIIPQGPPKSGSSHLRPVRNTGGGLHVDPTDGDRQRVWEKDFVWFGSLK